jgi:predicted phosphoribosyltransferase
MKDFLDDADAARQLVEILDEEFDAVIAVLPHAVKIAIAVASSLEVPIIECWVESDLKIPNQFSKLLIVDDGVETGRKATSIAVQLGESFDKCIAVPICSREIESGLLPLYRKVYAVKRPFVRRSLDWHYEVRPHYSATEARLLLETALD